MIVFTIFLKILGIIIFGIFISLFLLFSIAFYSHRQKGMILDFLRAFFFDFLVALSLLFIFPPIQLFRKIFGSPDKTTSSRLPILLIHGYRMNSTNWIFFTRLLGKFGTVPVYTFDYSPWKSIEETAQRLAEEGRRILEKEGKSKMNLIGHSLGGIIARYWVEKLGGENQVNHLITIGTPHQGNKLAKWVIEKTIRKTSYKNEFIQALGNPSLSTPTKYLSIYSITDEIIIPAESAKMVENHPAIKNFSVSGVGHLSLLFSPTVVHRIFDELGGC